MLLIGNDRFDHQRKSLVQILVRTRSSRGRLRTSLHRWFENSACAPFKRGYVQDEKHYLNLPAFYQAKRDFFRAGLSKTKFRLLPSPGSYFQCADYSPLGIPQAKLNEADFCKWLTSEVGVAAIPVSAFYDQPTESGVIRFCFAKQEQTLANALQRLQNL